MAEDPSPVDKSQSADAARPTAAAATQHWLTPGVLGVGAASLFSDSSHELVTSLLPTFLTSTLHGGPGALGVIDGVADALTGIAKLAGGPLAADPRRRGRLASGGYLGTAIATAAIGLTVAVWQVALLRAVAWASRGIRSPARDTLLTSLASQGAYGRAFGIERAGDNAGAIIGPLLASLLVTIITVRHAIWLSIIPGIFAAVAITIAARQARRAVAEPGGRARISLNLRELRQAGLTRKLVPVAAFELGNVATTLLILRATDLLIAGGRSATTAASVAILLYAAHNGAATVTALVGGQLVDRYSPRLVFGAGAAVYVLGYAMFAAGPRPWPLVLVAFVLAGVGIGFAETAESAAVAQAVPERVRSNGFGLLGLVQAVGDLGSTLVAGLLWAYVSPLVAFGYAAAWMVVSLLTGRLLRARGNGSDAAASTQATG